jgi:hypothetical protein
MHRLARVALVNVVSQRVVRVYRVVRAALIDVVAQGVIGTALCGSFGNLSYVLVRILGWCYTGHTLSTRAIALGAAHPTFVRVDETSMHDNMTNQEEL